MEDAHFTETVILISEHNDQGAMGFVINKKFERTLNELAEFRTFPSFPLYLGGPVDNEHLFFIHRRNDLITGGELIVDNIYLGGDFNQALALISKKTIAEDDIRIFIGYCGWDYQELEAEIEEGSWFVMKNKKEIVFDEDPLLLLGSK